MVLAVVSFLASGLLFPNWYPPPIRVKAPDGTISIHRDMDEFFRDAIPSYVLLGIAFVLACWLLIRLIRYIHVRWIFRKRAGR